MIHVTRVTHVQMDHIDALRCVIQIERLPQTEPIPDDPPRSVDLPPDVHDALRRWLDPTEDQP